MTKGAAIQELVKDDQYQVFILDSPVSFPLWLFRHSYIVVNDHGTLTRWDVFHRNYGMPESMDYLHKNAYEPWVGLGIFYLPFFGRKPCFKGRLIGMLSGPKDSHAHRMVDYINVNAYSYEFVSRYNMITGPNSNTFTQWFLRKFPEIDVTLPVLAHGRGYKTQEDIAKDV